MMMAPITPQTQMGTPGDEEGQIPYGQFVCAGTAPRLGESAASTTTASIAAPSVRGTTRRARSLSVMKRR